jgi:hypothetical protein
LSVRSRILALFAAALLAPAAASAQSRGPYAAPYGPADQGLVFSGRVGFGVPHGDFAGAGFANPVLALGDTVDFKIPIWLELGYRFSPTIWGTLFLELAPASVRSSACATSFDCSASDVRLGIEVQVHLRPRQQLDPWLGVGFGAEFLNVKKTGPAPTLEQRYSGWEVPLLEGGLDVALAPRFSLGPYGSLSFGQYTGYRRTDAGVVTTSEDIGDQAWHGWFQIGVKATVKL